MWELARGVHVPDIPCPTLLRGLAEPCLDEIHYSLVQCPDLEL